MVGPAQEGKAAHTGMGALVSSGTQRPPPKRRWVKRISDLIIWGREVQVDDLSGGKN